MHFYMHQKIPKYAFLMLKILKYMHFILCKKKKSSPKLNTMKFLKHAKILKKHSSFYDHDINTLSKPPQRTLTTKKLFADKKKCGKFKRKVHCFILYF